MNLIIPFTKDIAFNSNISEILSISLEHDYTINEGELLGNFIVTGEYKTHEVSINKEYFEKVLPFSVELSELIDTNTLEFAIKDFTYEIIDPSTLRVNIEYEVNARETEVIKENTDVAVFREVEDVDFDEILDDAIKNLSENNTPQEQKREENKITKEDVQKKETVIDLPNEATTTKINNEVTEFAQDTDSFVTYNIHIMQDIDTIDAICTKYNTTTNILSEYNDLTSLSTGDKLIIPEIDE